MVEQFSTDATLEKMHEMYMGKLTMPRYASNAIDHIKALVNTETYRQIEDDLSIIMDSYETRAFKIGFRLGIKSVMAYSIEELR